MNTPSSPPILTESISAPHLGHDPGAANAGITFHPNRTVTAHRAVWFYVPSNFNRSLFTQLNGLHYEAYWLVHKIIGLTIAYRHGKGKMGWVNISRQTIRQFIHARHASRVRETLLRAKVIECNDNYIKGIHSKGYRIGKAYQGEIKRVQVTKRSIVAKMLAHRIRWCDKIIPEAKLQAVHRHFLASLRRVKINITQAYQKAEELPEKRRTTHRKRKLGSRRRTRMVKGYRKALCRMTVDQIATDDFDLTVDNQGRVHTPVTRLFTEARSCLSIDGKPLVSIDIANSQLIFFALLLLEHRYQIGRSDDDSTNNNAPTDPSIPSLPFPSPSGSIRKVSPLTDSLLRKDEAEFVTRVMDGTIYEELMEIFNQLVETENRIKSRKEFKGKFFQAVLYGDNNRSYARDTAMAVMFQHMYPSVWEFITSQKAWWGEMHQSECFKRLSIQMQQREARFIIGKVCRRLMEHHAETPLLTIHDSILTTDEHVDTVVRVMAEEFMRLGVHPKLRIER